MKSEEEKKDDKKFWIITGIFIAACILCYAIIDIRFMNSFVEVKPIENNISEEGYEIINLNTADIDELTKVEGIGPVTAEKIIAYREKYGSFLSVDELTEINGIGDEKLKKIRKYFTV